MKFFITTSAAGRLDRGAPNICAAFHLDRDCYTAHRARQVPVEVEGVPVEVPRRVANIHVVRGNYKGSYGGAVRVSVGGKVVGAVCGKCLQEAHRNLDHQLGRMIEFALPEGTRPRYPRPAPAA